MVGHSSIAVANSFLERFRREGREGTQLVMNKLVYITHGWHLAVIDHTIGLTPEEVIAWKYGPVFLKLREAFRDYGSSPITEPATIWNGSHFFVPTLEKENASEWEERLINWVWSRYGHLDAPRLVGLTHGPGTPWYITTKGGSDIGHDKVIPRELIREHYGELLKELEQQQRQSAS